MTRLPAGGDHRDLPIPVAFHWSGGKDSAHALGRILRDDRYQVRCLISTVDETADASTVHGLPTSLLQAQAEAIALPLHPVPVLPGLENYTDVMRTVGRRLHASGIRGMAFGDLEHSGAHEHRERLFAPEGLAVVEPLWGMTGQECIQDFLSWQIEAVTVVVDAGVLHRDDLGVPVDHAFIGSLPDGCDPCGEFGEYHTFVANAPYFRHPVRYTTGGSERIERRIGTDEGLKTFAYWQLHLHA